jgi:uncharacterized protein with beta-barrel porin domain
VVKVSSVRRHRREHWTRSILLSSAAYALVSCTSAHAQTVINVSDGASLSAAIAQVDSNASASYVINFQNSIALTNAANNTLNAFNTTSNVTVNGNGFTLNGGGVQRGFLAYTGTIAINNLKILDATAIGGAGGSATGPGGGGAGLGGALFVASGATVKVTNVTVQSNSAIGGAGGSTSGGNIGGGGGLGGAGGGNPGGTGDGGGGGLGALAAGGAAGGNTGSSGIVVGAGSGGAGGGGATGGTAAGGGGSGGPGQGGGGGGVGGVNSGGGNGGAGGFGGGGGGALNTGGNGGFGGGGGAGFTTVGGTGGFGGGGGSSIISPAAGGFGGGSGGTSGGGGGAGLGGAIFVQQGGTLTVAGSLSVNGNTVAGGASGGGGAAAGAFFGSGLFLQGNGFITFQPASGLTQVISDSITDQSGSGGTGVNAGSWGLNKNGAGKLVLSGINTYTGATTVNAGTLEVDGTLTGTSNVAVNAGGILTGTGTIDPLVVAINNGAIFAPGNGTPGTSTAIVGNLAFQSGALYLVQVNPATASFATVTGMATLGGATVGAIFAPGSYLQKQYTILTANGGVSGTFGSVVSTNAPANLHPTLSYDANDVFLNLALNFAVPGGLNTNQQAVANALTSFFNATGGIPAAFVTLTPSGLTQASGELATGSQQATFDAMSLFMGLLTDPFVAGRGDGASPGTRPPGYAEEQGYGVSAYAPKDTPRSQSERDAYAAIYHKAPPMADPFTQRWSVWAAGYGGSQTTDGNAALGSNTATSSIAGTVVGADYRFSPFTIAGFALAGGGTSFDVAGSGSGHSDLFQAGAFVRHTVGSAYFSAALAYGWQDITTNRTVSVAGSDQLRAEFNANAFSGRLEGGYRFVSPWVGGIGITPYAAAQFTTFDLPAYVEQAIVGSNAFALAYNAKDVTDTRSELGIRTDKSYAVQGAILILRSRFAWAHDFDPDRSIGATFQTLPGASFVVNGAAQAHDSALTTASVEMKWLNGWAAAATFEGEFSNVTRSYAGKGVVRYVW